MQTPAIQMTGFEHEPAELREAQLAALKRVLDSHHYILGREVAGFEAEWAQFCRVPYAVGVGNGMDAIEIAVRALGYGPGDEIIVPSMSAFASALGVARSGASPVLADVEAQSALLSLESARRCLSPKTRAILLVHLYGRMPDMHKWEAFCAEHKLALIEDCAQAHGASFQGRGAGTWGKLGAFSFYPTKNLGALGDAGCIVTAEEQLACLARGLRDYGQSSRYVHDLVGLNSRLDELQAALLRARLCYLDSFTKRRQEIGRRYEKELRSPGLAFPAELPGSSCVYHQFVCTHPQRDLLCQRLRSAGVPTLIHYPVGLHQQRAALDMRRDPLGLSSAEQHARECFSVPCHPQLTDAQVDFVVQTLKACVQGL